MSFKLKINRKSAATQTYGAKVEVHSRRSRILLQLGTILQSTPRWWSDVEDTCYSYNLLLLLQLQLRYIRSHWWSRRPELCISRKITIRNIVVGAQSKSHQALLKWRSLAVQPIIANFEWEKKEGTCWIQESHVFFHSNIVVNERQDSCNVECWSLKFQGCCKKKLTTVTGMNNNLPLELLVLHLTKKYCRGREKLR